MELREEVKKLLIETSNGGQTRTQKKGEGKDESDSLRSVW